MIMMCKSKQHHHRMLLLFILHSCFLLFVASAFSCSDYSGGNYTTDFCRFIACPSHCHRESDPAACMDSHYVKAGHCTKTGGLGVNQCEVVGTKPEWTSWCQSKACTLAADACRSSGSANCTPKTQQQWIVEKFSMFCEKGVSPPAAPGTEGNSGEELTKIQCWAPKSWRDSTCALCPNPQGSQCPAFGWTPCYPTEQNCINAGGSNCKKTCPSNTLGLKRLTMNGPSCYTKVNGTSFGPDWVPTNKTRFERYIKSPTELYKMTQTTQDDLPWLQNQWEETWNLKGCNAAAAVYENIVCAIEILTYMNKTFVGPKSGAPGNKITDFANNGDEQTDLRELAAFFSQSWKEVARMQIWEEAPSTGYRDCTIYPCGKSLYYQGRGPVQLSWNYNYGPFSEWYYGDKFILLDNPDKVDSEGPMGFIAYFWFWFTPRDFTSGFPISGSIRMRDAIVHWTDGKMNAIYKDGKDYDAVAGLGLATNVQNGGVECPPGSDSPLWRIVYFLTTGGRLGVTLPNMNDEAACKADKYCNGLFSGCSASAAGATCQAKKNDCGPRYVDGWTTKLCKPRLLP